MTTPLRPEEVSVRPPPVLRSEQAVEYAKAEWDRGALGDWGKGHPGDRCTPEGRSEDRVEPMAETMAEGSASCLVGGGKSDIFTMSSAVWMELLAKPGALGPCPRWVDLTKFLNRGVLAFLGGLVGILSVILLTSHEGPLLTETTTLYQLFGYFGLFCATVLILRVLVAVVRDGIS